MRGTGQSPGGADDVECKNRRLFIRNSHSARGRGGPWDIVHSALADKASCTICCHNRALKTVAVVCITVAVAGLGRPRHYHPDPSILR